MLLSTYHYIYKYDFLWFRIVSYTHFHPKNLWLCCFTEQMIKKMEGLFWIRFNVITKWLLEKSRRIRTREERMTNDKCRGKRQRDVENIVPWRWGHETRDVGSPSKLKKKKKKSHLKHSEWTWSCQPILDFWPEDFKINLCCFMPVKFAVICYSSNRKLIQP